MQPLISPVDHESRHHYYEDDSDDIQTGPREYSPLLPRFDRRRRRSALAPIIITLMFIMLIIGVTIGIYLLMEQDKQWPVNIPFEMVSRDAWGAKAPKWTPKSVSNKPVTYVLLTHTATPTCTEVSECSKIMKSLQEDVQSQSQNISDLPFNFMVGGDGETYEGRGWDIQADMDASLNDNSLCLAAIGNFTVINPLTNQLKEIKAFIDESIRRRKLSPNYKMVGRTFRGKPNSLFNSVAKWKHWHGASVQ